MTRPGEVATGDLQVVAVDMVLVERDSPVDCDLFGGAATLGIVATLDDGSSIGTCEAHRAVFRVVHYTPNTGGGL